MDQIRYRQKGRKKGKKEGSREGERKKGIEVKTKGEKRGGRSIIIKGGGEIYDCVSLTIITLRICSIIIT